VRRIPLRLPIALASCLAFSLHAPLLRAEDQAAAQLLFEQGRDLLRAGKPEAACPKLAESQRLDPATGTLLALAMCHEAEGKLASAWAEFSSVVSLASRDGNAEREQLARQRVAELKPRLSSLELQVSQPLGAIPGLQLHRNGVLLGRDAWNLPIPVDAGEQRVTASAPGRREWVGVAHVERELDAVKLVVREPVLEPGETSSRTIRLRPQPLPAETAHAKTSASAGWNGTQWVGVALFTGGVAAMATSGFVLLRALDKNDESLPNCRNGCNDQGAADRNRALTLGTQASYWGIAGGVLALGGIATWWWGADRDSNVPSASRQLLLGGGPEHVSLDWSQTF
jgi:hypothetical protein